MIVIVMIIIVIKNKNKKETCYWILMYRRIFLSVILSMELLVIFLFIVATLEEFSFNIFPQLTSIVVFVPSCDANIEKALEGECTSQNCGNVKGVSLDNRRELLLVNCNDDFVAKKITNAFTLRKRNG